MRTVFQRIVFVAVLGLVVGGACALWTWRKAEEKKAAAAAAATTRARQIEQVRQANLKLADKVTALRGSQAPLAAPGATVAAAPTVRSVRAEAIQTLAELSRARQVMIRPNGPRSRSALEPTADGQLPAEFAEMFGLGAAQFAALQSSLRDVRREAEAAILAQAAVIRESDNALRIEVGPIPALAAPRAKVRAAFMTAMGEEGVATYEALQPRGYDNLFDQQGGRYETIPTTVTVTRVAPGEPGGAGGGWGSQFVRIPGDATNLTDYIRSLGPLAKLVPEDLLKTAKP